VLLGSWELVLLGAALGSRLHTLVTVLPQGCHVCVVSWKTDHGRTNEPRNASDGIFASALLMDVQDAANGRAATFDFVLAS